MFWLVQLFVPIFVVVVLPVGIMWIIFRTVSNRDNKNAEVIIKAIESNSSIDAGKLVEALGKKEKTPEQLLQIWLFRSCIFILIGFVLGIFSGILAYHHPSLGLQYPSMLLSGISLAIGIAYLIVWFLTRKKDRNKKPS